MLALLLAVIANGQGALPLQLAPGQDVLYRAHVEGFPKAAWVVGKGAPVSDLPQLGGSLVAVLPAGSMVQVAGVMDPLPLASKPPALIEVVALPAVTGGWRAGYVQASGLAVFESLLARPAPATRFFASVVGRELHAEAGGVVLLVEIWRQHEGGVPTLIAGGLNLPAGPRLLQGGAGAVAVELGGVVTIVDGEGKQVFRSPAGQRWSLVGGVRKGFKLRTPGGGSLVVKVLAR